MDYDFAQLNAILLQRARELLCDWIPGGKVRGNDYCASGITGGSGESFKVDLRSGVWADFAIDGGQSVSGKDLVALFAKINGINNGQAYVRLAERYGLSPAPNRPDLYQDKSDVSSPPEGAAMPTMMHRQHGEPAAFYTYHSAHGQPLFYVARYEPKGEKKQFLPWTWSPSKGAWQNKAWLKPRPLYNLHRIKIDSRVLVVEGEKAAQAAEKLLGNIYVVTTWPGGASAVGSSDLQVLRDVQSVTLWPDADEPGRRAMERVATELGVECKIVNVDGQPEGWDLADALDEGWTTSAVLEWARPRAVVYAPVEPVKPEPSSTPPTIQINVGEDAIAANDAPAIPQSASQIQLACGIALTKQGAPIVNAMNFVRLFERYEPLKGCLWYDEFHKKFFTNVWTGVVREWGDEEESELLIRIQDHFGFLRATKAVIIDAVKAYAYRNKRNEPRDWASTLVWDEWPRCAEFFHEALGAPISPYVQAVSQNFWISMAARVFDPGSKVDTMVILEGKQGAYKSTALRAIGGPWYGEITADPENKDFYQQLQGKLLIEIPELDAFSKAEVTLIKRILSSQEDRFRPPYEKTQKNFPRQCVFVGTTNELEYLKDPTGGRRFWPVETSKINLDFIDAHRDQLFAEAVARFKAKTTWWDVPSEAAHEQEARREGDAWEDAIAAYLRFRPSALLELSQVAREALKIQLSDFDRMTQRRLSKILQRIGWKNSVIWEGGHSVRRWVKAEEGLSLEDRAAQEP